MHVGPHSYSAVHTQEEEGEEWLAASGVTGSELYTPSLLLKLRYLQGRVSFSLSQDLYWIFVFSHVQEGYYIRLHSRHALFSGFVYLNFLRVRQACIFLA